MNNGLLVHSCCAPCSSSVYEKLLKSYEQVTGFFYNPNIYPESEYKRRRDEYIRFAKILNYPVYIQEDNADIWNKTVEGYETEPERGKRCELCFKLRLEKTAEFAVENGFDLFTTVLTVSPHKDSDTIIRIGLEIANRFNINFLESDFKKQDGYKRSLELSKEYGLYRQTYCGCKYSIR